MDDLLKQIEHRSIRKWVEEKVKIIPAYFWEVPASSSGKYHPKFAIVKGGLLNHTKAAVYFGYEASRALELSVTERDIVIAALILHDGFKYGVDGGRHTIKEHDEIAAAEFAKGEDFKAGSAREQIIEAIKRHMGQWGRFKPRTELEKTVHLCDYFASRKEIGLEWFKDK